MTAPLQRPARREQSRQPAQDSPYRPPVASHTTLLPTPTGMAALEHNGTAKLNVRAHAFRATGRVIALVMLDIVTSQTLRGLAGIIRDTPVITRALPDRLGVLADITGLSGFHFAAALILGLFLAGAYGAGDQRRSVRRILVGCVVATLLPLWPRVWSDTGTAALQFLLDGAVLGTAVLTARLVLDAVVYEHLPAPLARTVLVGVERDCRAAAEGDIDSSNGFSVVGTVQVGPHTELCVEELRRELVEVRADTLVLCSMFDDETFTKVVRAAMMAECRVLSTARRLALPGVSPKVIWRRGRPFVEMRAVALRWQQLLLKRILDLVLAAAMLVCLSPLIVVLGVAVLLSSPGPLVYGQRRLGRYGRSFRCFKFRSMFADAEKRLANDPVLRAEYVRNGYKLPDGQDPRITPLGRWLRRTSLDELPQLWNVIRGDMSLVGPRPIVPDEIHHYKQDRQMLLLLKPGITGLWQVSGRSNLAYPERTNLELEYVERWTLRRDLGILLRTVPAVLAQRGAH